MSSYWAAVGVILVPFMGAVFKYWVWDFYNKKQSLDEQYSTRIKEAYAAIHERKFLPLIAAIYDSVAARKAILPTASTVEMLTERSIDARVSEVIGVISERIALDRSYRWACNLSSWVVVSWIAFLLALSVLFVVLFFRHYDGQAGIKSMWVLFPVILTAIAGGIGCVTLTLYRWALTRFITLLGANPL